MRTKYRYRRPLGRGFTKNEEEKSVGGNKHEEEGFVPCYPFQDPPKKEDLSLTMVDPETGEKTYLSQRLIAYDVNDFSKGFWVKTREHANPDYKPKPHNGENYFHVFHENQATFYRMNDIKKADFKGNMARNLHLLREAPDTWA